MKPQTMAKTDAEVDAALETIIYQLAEFNEDELAVFEEYSKKLPEAEVVEAQTALLDAVDYMENPSAWAVFADGGEAFNKAYREVHKVKDELLEDAAAFAALAVASQNLIPKEVFSVLVYPAYAAVLSGYRLLGEES
jgi:hypothetical protein